MAEGERHPAYERYKYFFEEPHKCPGCGYEKAAGEAVFPTGERTIYCPKCKKAYWLPGAYERLGSGDRKNKSEVWS